MTDERFKKIMADLGQPDSHSLLSALKQVANEASQEALKERGLSWWTEKSNKKCVYVAGAISAPSSGKFINNIRKGIQLSSKVFLNGLAPFCPFIDFHYNLVMDDEEIKSITTETFYNYSIEWLKKSDAVLLVSGWENSVGTQRELQTAKEMNIPVFHSLEELLAKFKE